MFNVNVIYIFIFGYFSIKKKILSFPYIRKLAIFGCKHDLKESFTSISMLPQLFISKYPFISLCASDCLQNCCSWDLGLHRKQS